MITIFIGDNDYLIKQKIDEMKAKFTGLVELFDENTISENKLPDIFCGINLFSKNKMVILKNISLNKSVWNMIPGWLDRADDNTSIIFIEKVIDKRSIFFKIVKKIKIDVKEFSNLKPWETDKAISWLIGEAKQKKINLTRELATKIVERVGVDEWSLENNLEKIRLIDPADKALLNKIVDQNNNENIFNILEKVILNSKEPINQLIFQLSGSEDAYAFLGLLSSQVYQMLVIKAADKRISHEQIAKDLKVSSYSIEKLARVANKLTMVTIKKIMQEFILSDKQLKTTSGCDPWVVVGKTLEKVRIVAQNR